MLLNIVSAVLVGGFIVIVAIGHVLVLQAVVKGRRSPQPPRAYLPVTETSEITQQSPIVSERKQAA